MVKIIQLEGAYFFNAGWHNVTNVKVHSTWTKKISKQLPINNVNIFGVTPDLCEVLYSPLFVLLRLNTVLTGKKNDWFYFLLMLNTDRYHVIKSKLTYSKTSHYLFVRIYKKKFFYIMTIIITKKIWQKRNKLQSQYCSGCIKRIFNDMLFWISSQSTITNVREGTKKYQSLSARRLPLHSYLLLICWKKRKPNLLLVGADQPKKGINTSTSKNKTTFRHWKFHFDGNTKITNL